MIPHTEQRIPLVITDITNNDVWNKLKPKMGARLLGWSGIRWSDISGAVRRALQAATGLTEEERDEAESLVLEADNDGKLYARLVSARRLLAGFVKKRKYARAEAPKLLLPIMQSTNQQRKTYGSEMFSARVVDYAAHLSVLGWERDAVDLPDEAGLSGADAAWLAAEMIRQPFVRARILLPEGFFPTPPHLVEELLRYAQPLHKGLRVLEPSAGNGAIARALRKAGVEPKVVEMNDDLRAILVADGFQLVGDDFLKFDQQGWDRILMNPPFERGQDMDHVRHAYDLLADGGILVAITSEGPFFREDRKATGFRDWLRSVGGGSHKNVEGSFKGAERSTGVQTRIVVVRK